MGLTRVRTAGITDSNITSVKLGDDAFHVKKLQDFALSSPTTALDIDLSSFTSDFTRFKLYTRHMEFDSGAIPYFQKLTASNTVASSGWYGGGSYAGEGITGTAQYSNQAGFYFLADNTHTTATTANYLGVFEIDWTLQEDNRVNATAQGVMRIESGQTCWINSGAIGINTGTNHGIRLTIGGSSSQNMQDIHYTLFGVKSN